MTNEGPQLEVLVRRLAETPEDFLAEPRNSYGIGQVAVGAVVSDLLTALGGHPLSIQAADDHFTLNNNHPRERNQMRLVLITSWLYYDEWFRSRGEFATAAYTFLATRLGELAEMAQAEIYVTTPDGREELARLALQALELRPAGESVAQAEDRLTTISSVERARVIREARVAEERARAIREEMARKAAEEAAASYGRE